MGQRRLPGTAYPQGPAKCPVSHADGLDMSRAWQGGSTTRWRKTRAFVLDRDGWTCQLCGELIRPSLIPPHPRSASVHHTVSRAVVGDDPRYLQAAHRDCNTAAGEPGRHDPAPRPRTSW